MRRLYGSIVTVVAVSCDLFPAVAGLQLDDRQRHLLDDQALLAVQVRLAHGQPVGDLPYPLALDELQLQDVVEQSLGGGHLALALGSQPLDGLSQHRAQALGGAALLLGGLVHHIEAQQQAVGQLGAAPSVDQRNAGGVNSVAEITAAPLLASSTSRLRAANAAYTYSEKRTCRMSPSLTR